MLPITKKFTNCTISNRGETKIQWIVMHYFGGLSTALECAGWFCNPSNNQGSADFCVDDDYIIQVNPDLDTYNSWHCGGGLQGSIRHSKYGICKNSNSIGIEMRPYNDNGAVSAAQNAGWYFHQKTVDNAVDLVKYLMKKYGIDADHVIMHADVTGKYCPAPWLDRPAEWDAFQAAIRNTGNATVSKPETSTKEKLAVDGSFGPACTRRSQQWAGTEVDGVISYQPSSNRKYLYSAYTGCWQFLASGYDAGSSFIRALQTFLKNKGYYAGAIDGWCGKQTVTAWQKWLQAEGYYTGAIDGSMGSQHVKAWQRYLNEH